MNNISSFCRPISYLQGMVDADPRPGRFILTGSQQFELMTRVTQSLAGRTAILRQLTAVHDLQRFERFVRLNAGDSPEMYFYRDSEGNEVDLLLPVGGRMHAIEIKAGATVVPDYFKGLRTFARHHPDALAGGCVVYGGEHGQGRSDWPVHSWRTLLRKPPH